MLSSKIDQNKVFLETGSEANIGFGHAFMPSYLGMLPPKAAFFKISYTAIIAAPLFPVCQ